MLPVESVRLRATYVCPIKPSTAGEDAKQLLHRILLKMPGVVDFHERSSDGRSQPWS
jgi:hypothetical protein